MKISIINFIQNKKLRGYYLVKKLLGLFHFKLLANQNLINQIKNDGERVTHLYPNDNYIAHLSIYDFATQYTVGSKVLDAGSGSGYGSAYLAQEGAKHVTGIELSPTAVEFSKKYFGNNKNLLYKQMDLGKIDGLGDKQFDIIFSSNVLEHVPEVYAFFEKAVMLLQHRGKLILAVPPIQSSKNHIGSIISNLNNPYHINIWTMRQWGHLLEQYFHDVKMYSHRPTTEGFNSLNTPRQTQISITDFAFEEITDNSENIIPTMTAIFIASTPRYNQNNVSQELIDHSFYVNLPSEEITYDAQGVLLTDVIKSTNTHVGRLVPGARFCQTFISNRSNLSGIALCIATYRKQIDSNLIFSLSDEDGKVVRTIEKNSLEIPDNSYYPFFFDTIVSSKNKKFTFCIETIDSANEFITIWTNNTVRNNCTKNGEKYDGGLCYKCCYRD